MPIRPFLPAVLFLAALGRSFAAVPVELPHDLIKDMVYNEVQDRERESYWQYHIDTTIGHETFGEQQVETKDGPVFRRLTLNGKPLDAVRKTGEDERLAELLRDPGAQAAVKRKHEEDEQRLERLMRLMPDAFVFNYDGDARDGIVALQFHPNPAFNPPTYEARVFHSLAGTVWVDLNHKRLVHLQGETIERVDFGFGLLGHIEKGGTFEIRRQPVNATHWKTALVDIHLAGKLIFFKTIAKEEREVRSDFRPVDGNISLAEAERMLREAAVPYAFSQ